MLHLGPWQIAVWPRLLALWDAFGIWLADHPFYAALLVATCFIWAARGDSWRVHILPVAGLLLVMLTRLAALGSLWLANLALAPPLWCNEIRLAVHGMSCIAAVLLTRGALFLLLLACLRLALVLGLAGGGVLHRRRRVVDWALRLAMRLEGSAAVE